MPSKKYRTYYSEKEKVYAIQEIKENIITLECDVTKIHQNLKNIGQKIYYLYDAMTESSESSSSESSSAEAITIVKESEESDSDYTPYNTPINPEKKILKVMHVNKKSGNKKMKPRRRNPA